MFRKVRPVFFKPNDQNLSERNRTFGCVIRGAEPTVAEGPAEFIRTQAQRWRRCARSAAGRCGRGRARHGSRVAGSVLSGVCRVSCVPAQGGARGGLVRLRVRVRHRAHLSKPFQLIVAPARKGGGMHGVHRDLGRGDTPRLEDHCILRRCGHLVTHDVRELIRGTCNPSSSSGIGIGMGQTSLR